MGSIELTPGSFQRLVAEALAASPRECCGLVAGRTGRIERVEPVRNVAPSSDARYEMDPTELWAARRRLTGEGMEVIGFYHSHPRTAPAPSSLDVEHAYYPEAVYVIVGVEPAPAVRAFRIVRGRADEVATIVR